MKACDPFEPELPDCDLDLTAQDDDLDLWEGAWVVLNAARCIAEESSCAGAYKCTKGNWGTNICSGDAPHGIVLGPLPATEGECCGGISVGVRWPDTPEINDGCLTRFDVEYDIKITWPCHLKPYLQMVEASRFKRLLADTVCCKTPDYGDKTCPTRSAQLTRISTEADVDCPSIVLTLQLSK